MKKKTKRKQSLNNLLIILLLSVILLIMSTYAWFTSNKQVDIDAIDVKVSTSSGLQISANAIDWKNILTKDAIEEHVNYDDAVNQLPLTMQPVSSALNLDAANKGFMEMFFGEIKTARDIPGITGDGFYLTSTKETERDSKSITGTAKGNYAAFDVFIKTETDSPTFYMSGSVVEKVPDGATSYTERGTTHAVRIAVVKAPDVAEIGYGADAQTKTFVGGTVDLWEPNADTHTLAGIENAIHNLGWFTASQVQSTSAALPCYGIATVFENYKLEEATPTDHPGDIKEIKTDTTNKIVLTTTEKAAKPIIPIQGGLQRGITKFRIYMWVEGQDVDCENNASGTNIEFNLSFRTDTSF